MESLDTAAGFMDDLLDFASDIGEEDDDEDKPRAPLSLSRNGVSIQSNPDDPSRSLPENAEEELEWLSNKDAFPTVETFILSVNPGGGGGGTIPKQQSPVSVLENSNSNSSSSNSTNSGTIMSCCGSLPVPVRRARSKRRRKRHRCFPDIQSQQWWWRIQSNSKSAKETMTTLATNTSASTIGRKCQHCQAEKTPQWRAGPLGPKTLCNACGVRYKSGRLMPEYRPASSPTFSTKLHSNSHRKIMEMRKTKQSNMVVKAVDKG